MTDLAKEAGRFRSSEVGAYGRQNRVSVPPPAKLVSRHMDDLVNWAKTCDMHPLIIGCVFHYEFNSIYPFAIGNEHMGWMWQALILSKWKFLFARLSVEDVVREHQQEYFDALTASYEANDSAMFVEYMLGSIKNALMKLE